MAGNPSQTRLLTQIWLLYSCCNCRYYFGPSIDVVQPLGDLFLRLIQFIIVPLIVSSLIVGVASTGSMETLGRIGGKPSSIIFVLLLSL